MTFLQSLGISPVNSIVLARNELFKIQTAVPAGKKCDG